LEKFYLIDNIINLFIHLPTRKIEDDGSLNDLFNIVYEEEDDDDEKKREEYNKEVKYSVN
jgi:hypothetical protein